MKRGRPLDIAIIGMACRFPGARNLAAFWENLLEARDCTRDVPPDRWDPATFFDPESHANDRVYCQRGGYLDAPIEFDPARHGVMPSAVAGGEPEQYLILDAARDALADAGMTDGLPGTKRVEVVIGRGNYFNRGNLTRLQHGRIVAQTVALLRALHPDWDETTLEAIRADLKASLPPFEPATITGQLTNATAGRIANRLDLSGASYVVDAASASSLVALDLGTRALIERRADLALVGGVYLAVDVDFPMVFCQLGALSRQGKARPFARDADGTLPGEGVGVVVLKRLSDAERDGDRIYAVVKGVGLASDGRRTGLATPSARGHARAIRRAYRQASIDPATVDLVEGHGLGVPASDRAELRALNAVFPPEEWGRRSLGSVSALIGHAMPAAGIAALIKTALSLHNRVLLPTPGSENPHPLLAERVSPFVMKGHRRPWIHGDRNHPRRAGVNAFGFAGINAHAILEEHSPSADGSNPGPQPPWETEAILLGAIDREAWIARASRLVAWLERGENQAVVLKDLASSLNGNGQGRDDAFRVGLVVKSPAELRERILAVLKRVSDPGCQSIRDARGTYFWNRAAVEEPESMAFLFPGEGSQYPGMLADLCPHFPEVRALFDTADRIARDREYKRLPSQVLFGGDAAEDEGLWSVGMATNVVLSSQWALHQLLVGLGLRPAAVVGHSSGEFLALAAAGALSVDRQLETSLGELGRVFEDLEASGQVPTARLVAIAADRQKVEQVVAEVGPGPCIAIDNCPHQVVLAGEPTVVAEVVLRLRGLGVLCEDLPFDRAYHTEAFAATLDPLRSFFKDLPLVSPRVDVYSCAVASRLSGEVEEIRRVAVEQWARPVAFRSTIEAMYHNGIRTFVEVGARGNLTGFVDDILRDRPHFAIAANLPRRSGLTQLNHLVASLYARGVELRADRLYERRRPIAIDLDRDLPARPTVPTIEVGFPEMRFSPALVARLQSHALGESAAPAGRNGHAEIHDRVSGPSADHDFGRDHTPFLPLDPQVDRFETSPEPSPSTDPAESMMLEHLRTMDAFLETQRQVMAAYELGLVVSEPRPVEETETAAPERQSSTKPPPSTLGPWVGTIERLVPGRELVAVRWLEVEGDPVAEHHTLGGRRVSALEPSRKGLPVVPFTVMSEMLAQAASVLAPGRTVVALRDVQALKWIRYEAEPVALELRAWRENGTVDEVQVVITNKGTAQTQWPGVEEKVVEGRVLFGDVRGGGPAPFPLVLNPERECRFTAEQIYSDQWLFHGPAMQAIVGLSGVSPQGIEGTLKVLPRRGLLRESEPLALRTDPIVLDAFTQLLGCWGMDQLGEGDVIFPLRVAQIAFFGEDPPEGGQVACRIAIRDRSRHLVRVDADIVAGDGRVWMRIEGWEDWRFHWPNRCRDHFRQPNRWFIGEPLPLPLPGASDQGAHAVQGVWLELPIDFSKPIWGDVLEWVQLGPEERRAAERERCSERESAHWLWERVAAKEAVCRLLRDRGEPSVYPADLVVEVDGAGGGTIRFLGDPARLELPTIAMAAAEGVAVAVATFDSAVRPGIAIGSLEPGTDALRELSACESALLESLADPHSETSRAEWAARLACAKQAARSAIGTDLTGSSSPSLVVARMDEASGEVDVSIAWDDPARNVDAEAEWIRVMTDRKGADYVWAWTTGDRPSS